MEDWSLLRSFVAVAEHGSLSAAARALGSSQPTLGRHVEALETSLGVTLFARHARGFELTQQGAELYELAAGVRDGVDAFSRKAAGLDEGLEGTVRVSASEIVATFVLPEIIARLRRSHPGIQIEVASDNRTANLLRRDADVAVRMYEPRQQDVIARRITVAEVGLYASHGYVSEYGLPTSWEDVPSHTIIGFDRDTLALDALATMGVTVGREFFAVRTDAQVFHPMAVRAGVGIGPMMCALAERLGGLRRVMPELAIVGLPVWVVAHPELRRSPRVRAVFDALVEGLKAYYERGDVAASW